MVSHLEDAPEDALSQNKLNQNPISRGDLTPQFARKCATITALLAVMLSAYLGVIPFILGLTSLVLGFFFSFRGSRLKKIPYVNLILYGLIVAGLQYLVSYFAYTRQLNDHWFWLFIFVITISVTGELLNYFRQTDKNPRPKRRHLACTAGERTITILLFISIMLGLFSGAVSLIIFEIIPLWVIVAIPVLSILLILPSLFQREQNKKNPPSKQSIQKAVERATALALLMQYVIPWLGLFISFGWL
jgi:4-hydroxybenzoate polyprenyltransferase